jgi:biopolymer transport protein ExbD
MASQTLADPQMNATPLIDVLLVLLVMLIFTLPVATHAIKLNLPHPVDGPPIRSHTVYIDFDGQLSWDGRPMASLKALEGELRAVGAVSSQPRVKVAPDPRVRYDTVAQVLAAAQRSGVTNLAVN